MLSVPNNAWYCQTFNFICSNVCVVALNYIWIFMSLVTNSIVTCSLKSHYYAHS